MTAVTFGEHSVDVSTVCDMDMRTVIIDQTSFSINFIFFPMENENMVDIAGNESGSRLDSQA